MIVVNELPLVPVPSVSGLANVGQTADSAVTVGLNTHRTVGITVQQPAAGGSHVSPASRFAQNLYR